LSFFFFLFPVSTSFAEVPLVIYSILATSTEFALIVINSEFISIAANDQ
jgi:hypothetical protein